MTKYAVCASILMLLSSTLTASAEHDDPAWIVHREYPGPFHLGDENIGSWASLVGSCMDVTFPAVESGGKVQLLYEPYGVENAYLELDDGRRFSLAPQVVQSGTRPNYWGAREYIIIDVPQSSGSMSGRICSDFLDPTDLDDLMIRNVATLGLSQEQALPGNITNAMTSNSVSEGSNKDQSLSDITDVQEQAVQLESAQQLVPILPDILDENTETRLFTENSNSIGLLLRCDWGVQSVIIAVSQSTQKIKLPHHIVRDRANGVHEVVTLESEALLVGRRSDINRMYIDAFSALTNDGHIELSPTRNQYESSQGLLGVRISRTTGGLSVKFPSGPNHFLVGECSAVAENEHDNITRSFTNDQFRNVRRSYVSEQERISLTRQGQKF